MFFLLCGLLRILYCIQCPSKNVKEIESKGNTMYCVGGDMAMVCMCFNFYFVLGSLCLFIFFLITKIYDKGSQQPYEAINLAIRQLGVCL